MEMSKLEDAETGVFSSSGLSKPAAEGPGNWNPLVVRFCCAISAAFLASAKARE